MSSSTSTARASSTSRQVCRSTTTCWRNSASTRASTCTFARRATSRSTPHHTVEDTALALGQALREALGDKAGIRRFGDALVPLDETLCQVAVDLSGRPYLVHTEPDIVELIGTYETTLTKHIWESFVAEARICLHVRVLAGRNAHHVNEAQFKAVARALRDAVRLDGVAGIPSTKGVL